ncbi:MAG: hypothetical protein N3G80_04120 [Candidatus Micrarchaeota archaeon]|nr:hypothetical protein [Candidatus Micrarchaeota archaeon]
MAQMQQAMQQTFLVVTRFKSSNYAEFRFFLSERKDPGMWLVKEGQLVYSAPLPLAISKLLPKPKGLYLMGTADFRLDGNGNAFLEYIGQNLFYRGESKDSAIKALTLEKMMLDFAKDNLRKNGTQKFGVAFDKENPIVEPAIL